MSTPDEQPTDFQLDALLAEAGWVKELARRLARDEAEAEDLAQGTLAAALEKRPALRGGLRPWLNQVARRLSRHRDRGEARRRAREEAVSLRRQDSETTDVVERLELQRELARRVTELPEPYRTVLARHFYLGQSVREIAREASTSPATVRSQIARGLVRLRAHFQHRTEGRRSAFGVFLLASGGGLSTKRSLGELILLNATTKKVATCAAVLLVFGGAYVALSSMTAEERLEAPEVIDSVGEARARRRAEERDKGTTGDPQNPLREDAAESEADRDEVLSSGPERPEDRAETSTIRVRVLDEEGAPVPGAIFRTIHADGRLRGAEAEGVSRSSGHATLTLTDASMNRHSYEAFDMIFSLEAPGRATEFLVKKPRLHGETDLGDVFLKPGASFRGRCVDERGRPIPGAVVYAVNSAAAVNANEAPLRGPDLSIPRPRVVAGPGGRFVLSGVATGRVDGRATTTTLWAHAPSRQWALSAPRDVRIGAPLEVPDLILERVPSELLVAGQVFSEEGDPVPWSRIDFMSTGPTHYGELRADDRGHFELVVRNDAPVEFVARDEDAEGRTRMSASVFGRGGETIKLGLQLRRKMGVRVLDEAGEPLTESHLMPVFAAAPDAEDQEGRLIPGQRWIDVDAEGRAQFDVPGQRFAISVRRMSSGWKLEGPFDPETVPETLDIILPRGREVRGQVLADGDPVPGARVYVMRRYQGFVTMAGGFPHRYPGAAPSVLADAEGYFRAPARPEWTALGVVVRHEGYATAEISLDLPRGKGADDLTVELVEGGAIEGEVLAAPGSVRSVLRVAASRGDGEVVTTRVSADGRYRFEGLTPGPWRVEGRRREPQTQSLAISRHPDDLEPQWNAEVTDGGTFVLDIDLREPELAEVHGRLRVRGDIDPGGWTAELRYPRHGRELREPPSATLDGEGNFVLAAPRGRAILVLNGVLPRGEALEVRREILIEGEDRSWEGELRIVRLSLSVMDAPRARLVRGDAQNGETTEVRVPSNGSLEVRVPPGKVLLQVPRTTEAGAVVWQTVKTIDAR